MRGTGLAAAAVVAAVAGAGCTAAPIDVGGLAAGSLDDLIAHWSFDDASGSMVRDESRNMRAGIVRGATPVAGHFGGALAFQDNQQVVVHNFPAATESWTVSAWARPEAAQPGSDGYVTLLSTEIPFMGGWEMNVVPIAGMMRYHFGYYVGPLQSDYDFVECTCARPGQWTHVAAIVDGAAGTLSLYIDGALSGDPAPIRRLIAAGSSDLFMASWLDAQTDVPPTRYLTGALDDVAIWQRALVPSEVRLLASQPAPTPSP